MAAIKNRIVAYRTVKASELLPNPNNWRTHPDAQRRALQGILEQIGYADALLARQLDDGRLQLVDGHLRRETTPDDDVPVLVLDLNESEAELLLATLDPLAGMAEADTDALKALLAAVEPDSSDVQSMLENLAKDEGIALDGDQGVVDAEPQIDRADELLKVWKCERGQVWEVPGKAGTHRVMCGDSGCSADVQRLMDGKQAFLLATDPPYGVDFVGAKYNPRAKEWDGITGDKKTGEELRAWLLGVIKTWLPHVRDDAGFYFWTAAMQEGAAAAAIRDSGLHIQVQIIWVKNTLVLGQSDYQWRHENCWYAFKKGKHHKWNGGRSQTTVWEFNKVANSAYLHPMQKPLEIYQRAIENHTVTGDVVAEPFGGSGSQWIAAENLGRVCYGLEIEPKYVAVCLERCKGIGLSPRLVWSDANV